MGKGNGGVDAQSGHGQSGELSGEFGRPVQVDERTVLQRMPVDERPVLRQMRAYLARKPHRSLVDGQSAASVEKPLLAEGHGVTPSNIGLMLIGWPGQGNSSMPTRARVGKTKIRGHLSQRGDPYLVGT